MSGMQIGAIVLIIAGIVGLAVGSFSYTKETHRTDLGPIEFSVTERETVNIPLWAGLGAIVLGGALLIIDRQKS